MPEGRFISVEEKAEPGFESSKDRLMLLLGGHTAGDSKLKPLLVYHSENPKALKGYSKPNLPTIWRSNRTRQPGASFMNGSHTFCALPLKNTVALYFSMRCLITRLQMRIPRPREVKQLVQTESL